MIRRRTQLVVAFISVLAIGSIGLSIHFLRKQRATASRSGNAVRSDGVVANDHVVYTTRPLTINEMRRQVLPVKLPSNASAIQFAEFSEWQVYELYASFRAPPDTCAAYANAVLDDYNNKNPNTPVPGLGPLAGVPTKLPSANVPLGWFTPETIQNGMEGGKPSSGQPKVWVDSARGIFYYQCCE